MKKTSERFNRAIKALVKGYMNNTLVKGDCAACAVGNIVAEAIGIAVKLNSFSNKGSEWVNVFSTDICGIQSTDSKAYRREAKLEIDATGYSWQELAKVEHAFETSTKIHKYNYSFISSSEIDEDQLNGLYAVVDVLCEIEGIVGEQEVKEYKELFVKEPAL